MTGVKSLRDHFEAQYAMDVATAGMTPRQRSLVRAAAAVRSNEGPIDTLADEAAVRTAGVLAGIDKGGLPEDPLDDQGLQEKLRGFGIQIDPETSSQPIGGGSPDNHSIGDKTSVYLYFGHEDTRNRDVKGDWIVLGFGTANGKKVAVYYDRGSKKIATWDRRSNELYE